MFSITVLSFLFLKTFVFFSVHFVDSGIEEGRIEVAKYLVRKGVDVNVKGNHGVNFALSMKGFSSAFLLFLLFIFFS